MQRPFHTKSEKSKPQAEGNANVHLYRSRNLSAVDRRRLGYRLLQYITRSKLQMQFIPVIKAVFSASLLQSSVSHDPSEITLI